MTDYYELVDEIQQSNKRLAQVMNREPTDFPFSTILKQIIVNAERNARVLPQGQRHSEVIKKISIALFIYAGPLAYEFLQKNLHQALPSLRTIQRHIHTNYETINEGEFRFDGLASHIIQHKTTNSVTIGEDATRVISRVEYDSQTDRCVGFVLPLSENGLPLIDSFLAVSFDAIKNMFAKHATAKYAYVFMAQPLAKNTPAFCLACFGTDNKFSAAHVLMRWRYIMHECEKKKIVVVSFGGDGDSRLMKAMKSSVFSSESELHQPSLFRPFSIPSQWRDWFWAQNLCSVAFVQDTVHIAVKLKSRLIRPSIVLPMGNYLAGVHHLKMLQATLGKDEHGLRERDIDHKDKQNFDAVSHIIKAMPLLDRLPDALGTKEYITLIYYIVDSYLDKALHPLARIEKIWYATFFVRYWRSWILKHPKYTLQNNFITHNAYMCIEFNAHATITFLHSTKECGVLYMPWLLGSQSCEKIFRLARSMTSTFSTIINFGMLGLLRRLHRLQMQSELQAESCKYGVIYPQLKRHENKDGRQTLLHHSSHNISQQDICHTVCNG